ncbi:MAG TPA: CHRD domain-containing protein [Solirubrobacter sp.]
MAAAVCASVVASFGGMAGAATGTHALKAHLTQTASALSARHATGTFTSRLRIAGDNSSFTWKLTSGHLSGAALHAGIYFGRAAKASQLAMLLCNKCSPTAQGYYHGSYVSSRRFVRAILHERAYVVVQTKKNPKGEILGRIKPN